MKQSQQLLAVNRIASRKVTQLNAKGGARSTSHCADRSPRYHDCEYVQARNALIPQAARIAKIGGKVNCNKHRRIDRASLSSKPHE